MPVTYSGGILKMENATVVNFDNRFISALQLTTAGDSVTAPTHTYGPAIRPYYLLHFITAGEGSFITATAQYHLKAGDGFFISPHVQTKYVASSVNPWQYFWIGFTGSAAPTIVQRLALTDQYPIFKTTPVSLKKIMTLIANTVITPATVGDEFHLLGNLFHVLSLIDTGIPTVRLRENNPYINQALTYIQQHFMEPLTVTTIANHIGLNRSYLTTLFKQTTGTTPASYITTVRITYATHLLESSNAPIKTIAHQCGYSTTEALTKAFKRVIGGTPASYRQGKRNHPYC